MKVENQSKSTAQGTVRIFILPIYDEKGQQYLYEGSRNKAVEIDRFLIKSKPKCLFKEKTIALNIYFYFAQSHQERAE